MDDEKIVRFAEGIATVGDTVDGGKGDSEIPENIYLSLAAWSIPTW